MRTAATAALVACLALGVGVAGAQDLPAPQPAQQRRALDVHFDPYAVGWSSEPAMESGGLMLASAQRASSKLLGSTEAARTHPGVAAAWEFPFAMLFSIVTHEVNGHGGRGREFDLRPRYGFDLPRLAAYTGLRRAPKSRDEIIFICAAGTEADSVLAHRLLMDLARPGGAEASTVPLALFAKLDLTMYVAITKRAKLKNALEFRDQYREGNDIANYLVARQGQRRLADVGEMWNQILEVDYRDPLLRKNDSAVRVTALWNALDPGLITTVLRYSREHLAKGEARIRAPMLEVGNVLGITAGTRGFLGPSYVTRYLDLYVRVPFGVGSVYLRDLDSSVERTYGWGGSFTVAPADSRFAVTVAGDWWDEPDSAEYGNGTRGWHGSAELRLPLARRFGILLNGGRKTAGFVPGRPVKAGTYFGVGAMLSPW